MLAVVVLILVVLAHPLVTLVRMIRVEINLHAAGFDIALICLRQHGT